MNMRDDRLQRIHPGRGKLSSGFLASWMIPHFGWRSIFYFGGAHYHY